MNTKFELGAMKSTWNNWFSIGGDSNYQTATSPAMPKKNASQQPDCQYTGSAIGGIVACTSSNNSSILSKTSDLIDTSDPKNSVGLIQMNDSSKRKGEREGDNSSDFSDQLAQEDSQSSYQRLMNDGSGVGVTLSRNVVHTSGSNAPLTFENRHSKREIYPFSSTNGNGHFITPTHLGRPLPGTFKAAFRSLSIDSNLDNLSSTDYPSVKFSPTQRTRRGQSLHQKMRPLPPAAPDKRFSFITNSKALSPEIRGSFV